VKLLVAFAAALLLVPAAGASTIWFASEHVATPSLGVRLGIDGHGARTLTWGPILARSSRGESATAEGTTLLVDGNPVATTAWPIDDATFSPDGRTIAFTDISEAKCDPAGLGCATWELWLVHTDGSGLREITPDGKYPRFSPDGRKLAFLGGFFALDSYGTAVVQNLVTGARTWLTTASDAPPVWSPDSNHLAYTSARMRVATLRPRSVRSLGPATPLAYSPDGRRLLYATSSALFVGTKRVAIGSSFDARWSASGWIVYAGESSRAPLDFALYRVRPDGTHRSILRTFLPTTYLRLVRVDAKTIVFQETQSRQGLAMIDAVDPDTGDLRRVHVDAGEDASPTVAKSGALAYMKGDAKRGGYPCLEVGPHCATVPRTPDGARDPVWAPDGLRLAFIDYPKAGERDLTILDATDAATSVLRAFDGPGVVVQSPTWSPDGHTLVVATNDGMADGHIHLLAVDAATGAERLLGTGDVGMAAAYSPVDVQLAFVGGTWGGPYRLELYDTQTGAVTDLRVPAAIARPAFSPDGSHVAYLAPDDSVHVIAIDGTGDRQVAVDALGGSALAWSP
jgi:Tol biopolymer transport system component